MNPVLTLATAMTVTLSLAGCGVDSESPAASDPGSQSSSVTPSETASSESSDEGSATEHSDPTGVTFSLPVASPVEPVPTTQPYPGGDPIDLRVYQAEVGALGATVTVGNGADFSDYNARAVYQGMQQRLSDTDASDVTLSGLVPVTADGTKGEAATMSFVASDGKTRNYWRMATFGTKDVLVSVQVLTFAPKLDAATRATVDDAFKELVDSLRLP